MCFLRLAETGGERREGRPGKGWPSHYFAGSFRTSRWISHWPPGSRNVSTPCSVRRPERHQRRTVLGDLAKACPTCSGVRNCDLSIDMREHYAHSVHYAYPCGHTAQHDHTHALTCEPSQTVTKPRSEPSPDVHNLEPGPQLSASSSTAPVASPKPSRPQRGPPPFCGQGGSATMVR